MTEKELADADKILIALYEKEQNYHEDDRVKYRVEEICRELKLKLSIPKQVKIIKWLIKENLVEAINYEQGINNGQPFRLDAVDITTKGNNYVEQLKKKSMSEGENSSWKISVWPLSAEGNKLPTFLVVVALIIFVIWYLYVPPPPPIPKDCKVYTFSSSLYNGGTELSNYDIKINGSQHHTTSSVGGVFEIGNITVEENKSNIELEIRKKGNTTWEYPPIKIKINQFTTKENCQKTKEKLDLSEFGYKTQVPNEDKNVTETTGKKSNRVDKGKKTEFSGNNIRQNKDAQDKKKETVSTANYISQKTRTVTINLPKAFEKVDRILIDEQEIDANYYKKTILFLEIKIPEDGKNHSFKIYNKKNDTRQRILEVEDTNFYLSRN